MPTTTHLTPGVCADLARRGDGVVDALRAFGVPVPPRHGLRAALEQLRAAAGTAALASGAADWARTAAAAQLVGAWVDVIGVVPPEAPPELLAELEGALRGTSVDDPSTDVLSQLALGRMLLDAGGLRVSVPPGAGARPDFRVDVDGHAVGVEVKRPRTPESARGCIKEGAGQLRTFELPGLVALDLGIALGAHELTRASYVRVAGEPPAGDVLAPRFFDLARELALDVDARQTRERAARSAGSGPGPPRFGAVHGLLCYARVFEWATGPDGAPVYMNTVSVALFPSACGAGVLPRLEQMRDRLRAAAEARAPDPNRSRRWSWFVPSG